MKIIIAVIALTVGSMAESKETDYINLESAGTGRVGDQLVRYLAWSRNDCIVVQNLVLGGDGQVSAQKEICSLNGKNFNDGYTDVSLKKGMFQEGKLFFELGVTSLRQTGEKIMICEVVFRGSLADHLSCQN